MYLTLYCCQKMKCSPMMVLTASLDQTSRLSIWHWNSPASWMLMSSHFLAAVAASRADCQSPLNMMSRGGLKSSSKVLFFDLLILEPFDEEDARKRCLLKQAPINCRLLFVDYLPP